MYTFSKSDNIEESLQYLGNQIIENLNSLSAAIKYWALQSPKIDLSDLAENHGIPNLETIEELHFNKITNSLLEFRENKTDLRLKLGFLRMMNGFIGMCAGGADVILYSKVQPDNESFNENKNADQFHGLWEKEFKQMLIKIFIKMLPIIADGIAGSRGTTTRNSSKHFYNEIFKDFLIVFLNFFEELETLSNYEVFFNFIDNSHPMKAIIDDMINQVHQAKTLIQNLVKLPSEEIFSSPQSKLIIFKMTQIKIKFDQLKLTMDQYKEDIKLSKMINENNNEEL